MIRSATKLTADLIAAADNMKVIGRAGVGVDNVDVEAATRRGIVVANAPESNIIRPPSTPSGCSSRSRATSPGARGAVEGRWERSKWGGVELAEKTLGVLGSAGSASRSRAARSGCRCASSPTTRSSRPTASASSASRAARFDEVLGKADFVTVHLPLNDETRGAINAEAIAKMKDGVRS